MDRKHPSPGPSGLGNSSLNSVAGVDEPCREKPSDDDLISAVEEFHVLSSKGLSRLIRGAENGIIKCTKNDGSSFKIHVESLARHLGLHILHRFVLSIQDEQRLRYVLSGIRLLHTLYDIASHHSNLERVLFEDKAVRTETLYLICSLIVILVRLGERIDGSNQPVLLYSAVLASGLYLIRAVISDWQTCTRVILATPEGDSFTIPAFNAVRVVVKFLQEKLTAQRIDFHKESNVAEVYSLFHFCESSLQFIQSLCKQMLFRERLVKNEKLYGEGVVLKLVKNILQLSECEDPHIMDVIYRLKSKALSIMLLLCEAQSASFLDLTSRTGQSLELAHSTAFEVLQVLKKMFYGALKNYPRGILQVNAMRLTEIFSNDPSFKTHIILSITEDLSRVFSLPEKEFSSTWCSNDHKPVEQEIIVDFDSISASGQMLGLISTSQIRNSTWSNYQAPRTPYAHHISSLLVKIVANLTCYALEISEGEKALFVNEFLECLQKQFSKLPGGAAERTDAASRNLFSLVGHAESLTPQYLNVKDVDALRCFISQFEELRADQESNIQRVMEPYNCGQCPSPTPQISSPSEHDKSGDHDKGVSVNLARLELEQLTFKEKLQNQSNDVVGDVYMIDIGEHSGAQNDEQTNLIEAIQVFRNEQSEEDKQEKKRKRKTMNAMQNNIIEKALLEEPDLHKTSSSLQLWANELSHHGPEVTPTQLKNRINYLKGKVARAAAKEARVYSMTEKQSGSGSDSPDDENYDPSPLVSRRTHQKNLSGSGRGINKRRGKVARAPAKEARVHSDRDEAMTEKQTESEPDPISDSPESSKTTQDTVVVPANDFKFQVGQKVMVRDDKGKEIGEGIIHQAKGSWFIWDLEKLRLCVVDVKDINVPVEKKLPYPTQAGSTFFMTKWILGYLRIVWDSSKLSLIE